ncbi:MAG: hypothetical protein KC964_21260 [Candidatus Omnitrophica bacterium]|nr:hypothetical protein [Candidatus Omnitrophota bacterium]
MSHFLRRLLWILCVITVAVLAAPRFLGTSADTYKMITGSSLTTELRKDMRMTAEIGFGDWVSKNGTLPGTLNELDPKANQSVCFGDPLPYTDCLTYRRISNTKAILYSVGYDGIDDEGKFIYDLAQDDKVLKIFPEVVVAHGQGKSKKDIPNFDLIRGDLVLDLEVVNDASGMPELEVAWKSPQFAPHSPLKQ